VARFQNAHTRHVALSCCCCTATRRSHLSYLDWKVYRPSTAAECALNVLGPSCTYPGVYPGIPDDGRTSAVVLCDNATMVPGSQWPLIDLTTDPVIKSAVVPVLVCSTNRPDRSRYASDAVCFFQHFTFLRSHDTRRQAPTMRGCNQLVQTGWRQLCLQQITFTTSSKFRCQLPE
jgi:hypothetical protein